LLSRTDLLLNKSELSRIRKFKKRELLTRKSDHMHLRNNHPEDKNQERVPRELLLCKDLKNKRSNLQSKNKNLQLKPLPVKRVQLILPPREKENKLTMR